MAKAQVEAVAKLLDVLWDQKGSDLLITAESPPLIRVDGSLTPLPGEPVYSPEITQQLVMGIMDMELKARFKKAKQLDFSFSYRDRARVRVNAFRQKGTLAMALRVIPNVVPTFDQLGLPDVVEKWSLLPQGFVLVIGATGSGKSTTLASMIGHINRNRACHIITIEDPIEYIHTHNVAAVEQREIGEDTESFPLALRAVLREDPDVVLVGEMRDLESIQNALTIAETGHLVFATLHANDTAQAVDRIVDVFPGDEQQQIRLQLANTLVGILYQTLVPKIGGGRVAAVEVLVANSAIKNLIREGKSRQIRNSVATGQRDGMQTLEARLDELVQEGVISYEEAVSRTMHPHEIHNPERRPPAEPAAAKRGLRR
ncbi:MAG: twitching motility protein PilT [Actinomycetota bacterium]